MSDLIKRLISVEEGVVLEDAKKAAKATPKGWEPGITWEPKKGGVITTGPMEEAPSSLIWSELIADWGLDPETTEIIPDSVQVRAWDANLGFGQVKRFRYYRAGIRPKRSHPDFECPDLRGLYEDAKKASRSKTSQDGDATLLVCLSDFQVGNPDFDGVKAQIEALAALNHSIPARIKALKKAGINVGTICLAGLGDLCEGTCGFYPSQQFRVQVDRRDQIKILRRALRDIIVTCSKQVDKLIVVTVPGNHGENRKDGKAYTRVGDNDDVAVFEQVADILSSNPETYSHINWRIPNDEIAVSVELSGKIVAFTHGHVAKSAGNAVQTMWRWWTNQAMGRGYPGVADADILVHGHYHHLSMNEQDGRLLVGCPSLTKVGEYYRDQAGATTAHGTLTFVIRESGWTDLAII